jgi:hypothetical protein
MDPMPSKVCMEDERCEVRVQATDPELDSLTYSASTALFDIDPSTGKIDFIPTNDDIGSHLIEITVTDVHGAMTTGTIEITIKNTNDPPSVELLLPMNRSTITEKSVRLSWLGTDPDRSSGQNLTYKLFVDSGSGLAQVGGELDSSEYVLEELEDRRTYRWTVLPMDGMSEGEKPAPFSFTVDLKGSTVNQPPRVSLIEPKSRAEVNTLRPTFVWEGLDADDDILTYSLRILDDDGKIVHRKEGLETNTYRVETPLVNGTTYLWVVIPHDGKVEGFCIDGKISFTVNSTGTETNLPPVVEVLLDPKGKVKKGTTIAFNATGSSDPDGTITMYIWTFGDGTTITGAKYESVEHKFEEPGEYDVTLVVFDNSGNSGVWEQKVIVTGKAGTTGIDPNLLMLIIVATAIAVALGTAGAFMFHRRVKYERYDIKQLFLVYRDGRLIKYIDLSSGTRELSPDSEAGSDIMGGMLTAVQDFVKDSLRDTENVGALNVLEYGDKKIVIERGTNVFLALIITGNATKKLRDLMARCIGKVETRYWQTLGHWDGEVNSFIGVEVDLNDLLK